MITRQCAEGLHGFCRAPACDCAHHANTCQRCDAGNLLKLFADGTLCADCYRSDAFAANRVQRGTPCDKCGASGAFRNPRARRDEFLCTSCHKAAGEPLELTSAVQGLAADCHGANEDDPRHDWLHVRGTRFACVRCQTQKFDAKLRAAMRREALHG